jgi:uncharacterized protein
LAKAASVADTSPLIGLARVDLLLLLPQLFKTVYVPEAVIAEATKDLPRPGATTIQQALQDGLLVTRRVDQTHELQKLTAVLDEGEAEALMLAQHLRLPVLMDEHRGRSVAKALGITVIGTGAVLIAAKKASLILTVAPYLDRLKQCGYRLSNDLVTTILQRCGEAC